MVKVDNNFSMTNFNTFLMFRFASSTKSLLKNKIIRKKSKVSLWDF